VTDGDFVSIVVKKLVYLVSLVEKRLVCLVTQVSQSSCLVVCG
jgi:hypothetical protein